MFVAAGRCNTVDRIFIHHRKRCGLRRPLLLLLSLSEPTWALLNTRLHNALETQQVSKPPFQDSQLQLEELMMCYWSSTVAFPVPPCDRLDHETIHVTKKKWSAMDIAVTTGRPWFCWWFGSLTNIVAEHSARTECPTRKEQYPQSELNQLIQSQSHCAWKR